MLRHFINISSKSSQKQFEVTSATPGVLALTALQNLVAPKKMSTFKILQVFLRDFKEFS